MCPFGLPVCSCVCARVARRARPLWRGLFVNAFVRGGVRVFVCCVCARSAVVCAAVRVARLFVWLVACVFVCVRVVCWCECLIDCSVAWLCCCWWWWWCVCACVRVCLLACLLAVFVCVFVWLCVCCV